MTYTADVLYITVHEWGDDGMGDYVMDKGGYRIGQFNTIEAALTEIKENFGSYELQEDGYIGACLIEDEEAFADPNGKFIADYHIVINRVERVSLGEIEAVCLT